MQLIQKRFEFINYSKVQPKGKLLRQLSSSSNQFVLRRSNNRVSGKMTRQHRDNLSTNLRFSNAKKKEKHKEWPSPHPSWSAEAPSAASGWRGPGSPPPDALSCGWTAGPPSQQPRRHLPGRSLGLCARLQRWCYKKATGALNIF